MDKDTIVRAAEALESEIIAIRRDLHRCPEIGRDLPKTTAYVLSYLQELGYEPEICPGGIIATVVGKQTGRCIMLRADMDGLKLTEQADVPFASQNGNMHACGHDMHTAMLLGAAKLLQQYRDHLQGSVKLVFQVDEEGLTGAKAMLDAGVLENPKPEAAVALHVCTDVPAGMALCGSGTIMAGSMFFQIKVQGVGCHGAMPETGVDPISIAAHIILGLQEIVAQEISGKQPVVLTVGKLHAGTSPNRIPQEAVIEGTLRSYDQKLSDWVMQRIQSVAESTAQAFRGKAEAVQMASAPPMVNDPTLMEWIIRHAKQLLGDQKIYTLEEGGMGSEDFAVYSHRLPCAYLLLGAGTKEENPLYGKPIHNPQVVFHEGILQQGTALLTWIALKWLQDDMSEINR